MIIGASQYSKDLSLIPEGIMLTLPTMFFNDRGCSVEKFKPMFERYMQRDDAIWNFKLTNLPKHDIAWVYLVFDKHIQYRCNFVQYERNVAKAFQDAPDGRERYFPPCNWVLLTGPAVRPPYPMPQKGFQGFLYTTKIF